MKEIKFAVFTDLHYDHIHDGFSRMEEFIGKISRDEIDFIVDLGDFCSAKEENKKLLDMLSETKKPHYHLLGNHDSDVFLKEEVLNFLGMKSSYYSFSYGNVKFIALDACYIQNGEEFIHYFKRNYNDTKGIYPVIPPEQLAWLKSQLSEDYDFFVILSHHSLENDFARRGVHNRREVQQIINTANASGKKVLLCINGHDHGDSNKKIGDTCYFGLNSMSYQWFGAEYQHFSYEIELHRRYPFLQNIVMYKEALHAVITITEAGDVEIEGMEGSYQTVKPEELGLGESWNGRSISPNISSMVSLD